MDQQNQSGPPEQGPQPQQPPPGPQHGPQPQPPPPGPQHGPQPQPPPPGPQQGPQPQPPPPGYQPPPGVLPPDAKRQKDERMWAMFCHLSAIILGVLGPLIFWLIKKDEYPMVDKHGKAALNFQLSMMIYSFAAFVLCFILIGFIVLPALVILDLVCIIMASVKANEGVLFKYPLAIQFIK